MGVKITVLMCCYNGERFLKRALESLVNQQVKLKDSEVLFIDDGSSDNSLAIAKGYTDKLPITCFSNNVNKGLVVSCNRGLEIAQGSWIIRLDSDDAFAPEMITSLFEYIDYEKSDFIYTNRRDIYWDIDKEADRDLKDFNIFKLIASGICLKKKLLRKIGGYNNLFWEEYDLYIRYLEASGKMPVHIPKTLYYYSIYEGNMTSNKEKVDAGWRELVNKWDIQKLRKYGDSARLK